MAAPERAVNSMTPRWVESSELDSFKRVEDGCPKAMATTSCIDAGTTAGDGEGEMSDAARGVLHPARTTPRTMANDETNEYGQREAERPKVGG